MARKSKEDAEKTRQAVLESALDVFSEKGYAKATFDEIALRAGFTKGAVYWYFRNKADLVGALIVEYFERKRWELAPRIPECNTLDDLLEYFCVWATVNGDDERFAKFNRFTMCQMEWSESVIQKIDKVVYPVVNWHLEKIKKVLVKLEGEGKLKAGLDIPMTQQIIMSTYMGIVFSYLSKRHEFNLPEIVKIGLGLLFESIKK